MKTKSIFLTSALTFTMVAVSFFGCKKDGLLTEKADKIRIDLDFTQPTDSTITFSKSDINLWDTPELKVFKDKRDKIEGFALDSITCQFSEITGVDTIPFGGHLEILNKTLGSTYDLQFSDIHNTSFNDTIPFPKFSHYGAQLSLYTIFSKLSPKLKGQLGYHPATGPAVICEAPVNLDCVKGFYTQIASELIKTDIISFNSGIVLKKTGSAIKSGKLSIRIHFKGKFPAAI